MDSDLNDIRKIVSLFDRVDETKSNTKAILLKICEHTDDLYRSSKGKEINQHIEEYVNIFNGRFGCISDCCSIDKCDECLINKWCNHYRNKLQLTELKYDSPTYADFFCGAGGLSYGFYRAGFRMSLANDIQKCCIDTLALNHPEVPGNHIISADIKDVITNIAHLSRYKKVDVVIGGPPCQGFSMANRQRIIDDPRNHLYKSFIDAINVLQPNFFVMENVRGMLKVENQIKEDFRSIGYTTTAHLLNAKDFGVPQNRERVIFIGNRIGINNDDIFNDVLDTSKKRKCYVLNDALYGLPSLQAKTKINSTEIEDPKSGYTFALNKKPVSNNYLDFINQGRNIRLIFNHKARYNNTRDREIFRRMNPGDNANDSKIEDIMPYKRRKGIFNDKYYRLKPDSICKTITAHMQYDCNMYIHPIDSRGLTPREAARIQSYPDDYFFRGAYTKTYMQIGNSVPPLLSEAIANALMKALYEVR